MSSRHRRLARLVHLRRRSHDGVGQPGEGRRLVRQRVGLLEPARRPRRAGRVEAADGRAGSARSTTLGDVAGTPGVPPRRPQRATRDDGAVADDAGSARAAPDARASSSNGARRSSLASHLGRPKGEVEGRAAPRARRRRARGAASDAPVSALGEVGEPDGRRRRDASTRRRRAAREPAVRPGRGGERSSRSPGALAELADAYVNDAFGAAHRAHASVVGAARADARSGRPAVAGRLVQQRGRGPRHGCCTTRRGRSWRSSAERRSRDKLGVIDVARSSASTRSLIGGAMAFTLIAAEGGEVGASLVERGPVRRGPRRSRRHARGAGVLVELPVDVVAAAEPTRGRRPPRPCRPHEIPRGPDGPRHRARDGRRVRRRHRRREDRPVERPDGRLRARAVRRRHAGGRARRSRDARRLHAWSAAAIRSPPSTRAGWRTRSIISRPAAERRWSTSRARPPGLTILEDDHDRTAADHRRELEDAQDAPGGDPGGAEAQLPPGQGRRRTGGGRDLPAVHRAPHRSRR